MVLVLRRTVLFVAFVLTFALLAAAAAHSAPRDIVPIAGFRPGTIVIKTGERRLYYVIDGGRALRFPVGVGRPGKTWTGAAPMASSARAAALAGTGLGAAPPTTAQGPESMLGGLPSTGSGGRSIPAVVPDPRFLERPAMVPRWSV